MKEMYTLQRFFSPVWEQVLSPRNWEFLSREILQIGNFRVVKSIKLGNIKNHTNTSTGIYFM